MQVSEPCPGVSQYGSGLRYHLRCPGLIHLLSLADHGDTCLLAVAALMASRAPEFGGGFHYQGEFGSLLGLG